MRILERWLVLFKLKSGRADWRTEAVRQLPAYRDGIDHLTGISQFDLATSVRAEAVRVAASMSGEKSTRLLIEALSDDQPQVRDTAADALGARLSPDATPYLLALLERHDSPSAIRALARIGAPNLESHLIERLNNYIDDSDVAAACIEGLAVMHSRAALPCLMDYVLNPELGDTAVDAILAIEPCYFSLTEARQYVHEIANKLGHDSVELHARAIGLLRRFDTQQSLAYLVATAVVHFSAQTRAEADATLKKYYPNWESRLSSLSHAIPYLATALFSPDSLIQHSAEQLLSKINSSWTACEEVATMAPYFIKKLTDEDPDKRRRAADLVACCNDSSSVPFLFDAIGASGGMFNDRLRGSADDARKACIRALARLSPEWQKLPIIQEAIDRKRDALSAPGDADDTRKLEILISLVYCDNPRCRKTFFKYLGSGTLDMSYWAGLGLGRLGESRGLMGIVSALERASKHESHPNNRTQNADDEIVDVFSTIPIGDDEMERFVRLTVSSCPAAKMLCAIYPKWPLHTGARRIVPSLLDEIANEHFDLASVTLLAQIPDADSVQRVLAAIDEGGEAYWRVAAYYKNFLELTLSHYGGALSALDLQTCAKLKDMDRVFYVGYVYDDDNLSIKYNRVDFATVRKLALEQIRKRGI